MAIIRWNPASDLINLHGELDRIFGDLAEGLVPRGQGGGTRMLPAFLPVDIERNDRELLIRASVPGFKPEEVNVTVDNGVLTIDARHEEEREEKDGDGGNVVRRERYTGRLYRQIALGDGVDSENVNARFENGELVVAVPLAQRPQPRRIPVHPGRRDGEQGEQKDRPAAELSGQAAPGDGKGGGRAEQGGQAERNGSAQPATTTAAS
jgi:HSP20 family protein